MAEDRYVDDYATCAATYATFRLYGPDLDPGDVSRRLGLEPTGTQRRGDVRGQVGARAPTGGWFLSSEGAVASRDVRRHLDWVLDRVMPARDALDELRASGHTADVSCYWASAFGHGGPSISPAQATKLATLRLEVWFDVYFPDRGADDAT